MPAWLHQQMLPPSWNHRAVVPPAVDQHALVSLSCTRQSGVIDVRYNSKVALTGFKVSVSQRIYCTYHEINANCFSKFTAVEPDLKSPVSISAPFGGFSHAPNFHLAVYGSNVMGVGSKDMSPGNGIAIASFRLDDSKFFDNPNSKVVVCLADALFYM
jgi:hypothetical protein